MDIQKEVSAIAQRTLGPLAPAAVETSRDGLVRLVVAGRRPGLEAVWVGDGWPSEVRRVVAGLHKWDRSRIVVARRLSPASITLLRELDANWIDGTGLARIVAPNGLLVLRQPAARADRSERQPEFSWSDVRKDVAELLLARRPAEPRAAEIAGATGWSAVAVAKALSSFDANGWTQKVGPTRGPGAQRHLVEPGRLLDSWAEAVSAEQRPSLLAHATFTDAVGFLNERLAGPLNKVRARWAASGWVGAQIVAPHVTSVPTLQVYVDSSTFDAQLPAVMASADVRLVSEGARIEIWRARPVVLSEARKYPTPVASAARLFADLNRLGGRATAAAQTVREQLLDF